LKNNWLTKVIRKETKKFLKSIENEKEPTKSVGAITDCLSKGMLRGKFVAISTYIKKTGTSQISSLMVHLKQLEKQEQIKSQNNRLREMTKIKAELNEIKIKQTIQRINEIKRWFFEKITKINKLLANMTKWRKKTQINNIIDEKGDITTNKRKSRDSLKSTLKIYIQVNWKI
jgi:bisphosphoglycerate-independent phosphoglycerate mutase (AlkP superfamily)